MRKEIIDSAKEGLKSMARELGIDEEVVAMYYGFDDFPLADLRIMRIKKITRRAVQGMIQRLEDVILRKENITEGKFQIALRIYRSGREYYFESYRKEQSQKKARQKKGV